MKKWITKDGAIHWDNGISTLDGKEAISAYFTAMDIIKTKGLQHRQDEILEQAFDEAYPRTPEKIERNIDLIKNALKTHPCMESWLKQERLLKNAYGNI